MKNTNYPTIIKKTTGEQYHQVICKSRTARNTGPVQMHSQVYSVKFGMVEKWAEENPTKEIIKVFSYTN